MHNKVYLLSVFMLVFEAGYILLLLMLAFFVLAFPIAAIVRMVKGGEGSGKSSGLSDGIADELVQLQQLKDEGKISTEEYNERREKLFETRE